MPKIKVSVIGLSYNGREIVPAFIESIYRSSLERKEIEIIIVDNASADGTVELIKKKYPDVKVMARKENIGSGAHNDALKIAKGEYLFFTDSDMKLERHCLENFYKTATKTGKDIALSPTLYEYDDKKKLMPSYSTFSRSFYPVFVRAEDNNLKFKEVFMAGFVFMQKDTAKKLRYIFDNDYFLYAEDFDLCLRMRLQGIKLYSCPDAVMYNKPPAQTTRKYIAQARLTYFMERNLVFTFFKICSLKTIILYLPYFTFMRILALLRELAKLDIRMFLTRLKAYFWIFLHLNLVMKKRKETQRLREKSDRYIFAIANEKYFVKTKLGFF